MSDSNDSKPTGTGTPVPDLIEQYRARREAWIAQADELARLRDDVRESAEREAMEIVTTARRDVRQIVMEARRELLVLSAQVQAALGEGGLRPDPAGLLNRGRDVDGREVLASDFVVDAVFAPEEAVKGMLDEARADMDKLVEDARSVPFQAMATPPAMGPTPEPPALVVDAPAVPSRPHSTPAPVTPLSAPPAAATPDEDAATASRVLLSSSFPSDAVPVQSSGRAPLYVGLVAVVGLALLAGAIWWLRGNDAAPAAQIAGQPTASAPDSPSAAPTPAASSATTATTAPEPVSASSGPLSLLVEARRSSWLRTTVDGQTDAGRMLAQGETVRLSAKQSVSLRVGDAGAVFVSVNNGRAAPLGNDGEVITRQFVAENPARAAAPAPVSTPPSQVATPPSQVATPQPPQAAPVQRTPALPPPVVSSTPGTPPQGVTPEPIVQPAPLAAAPPPQVVAPPTPPPPARAETTPPPVVARPESPAPAPAAATPSAAVVAASRQWLEAYHRQDRAAMAQLSSDGLQLADERRNEERFPPNVDVSRTLDRVSVQIAADTAVLTAVMTERSADNGAPPRVSPISQVWELRGNQWRVRQVRLVSEARLNQIFR